MEKKEMRKREMRGEVGALVKRKQTKNAGLGLIKTDLGSFQPNKLAFISPTGLWPALDLGFLNQEELIIDTIPISGLMKNERNKFDYSLNYKELNLRDKPELYRVGKGEQGVLLVQPYKSEILPHWRFKTPEIARESSEKIYEVFLDYKKQGDFVGMDMARKFLQMGVTRSRRYANHRTGLKYNGPVPDDKKGRSGSHGRETLPLDNDPIKAESAAIFREKYLLAREDPAYQRMRKEWQK
jgi:hypothetical protein